MNTKPILFSTPMVQAILNGTKLQTRRVIDPQPKSPDYLPKLLTDHFGKQFLEYRKDEVHVEQKKINLRYGQVGDVLWVRETLKADFDTDDRVVLSKYAADSTHVLYSTNDEYNGSVRHWTSKRKSIPSIHMPKEACRLFLKIKDIRVERLQDISEEDAISEGVLKDVKLPVENFQTRLLYRDYKGDTSGCADARSSFMTLWKSINGEQSWNENPWVWVIEFERIEKPENF